MRPALATAPDPDALPGCGADWGQWSFPFDLLLPYPTWPPHPALLSPSAFPVPLPLLASHLAAPALATSSPSRWVHSAAKTCYASSRSISFSCDCTLSALITASLTPSVIGDRPSHPIWRETPT